MCKTKTIFRKKILRVLRKFFNRISRSQANIVSFSQVQPPNIRRNVSSRIRENLSPKKGVEHAEKNFQEVDFRVLRVSKSNSPTSVAAVAVKSWKKNPFFHPSITITSLRYVGIVLIKCKFYTIFTK